MLLVITQHPSTCNIIKFLLHIRVMGYGLFAKFQAFLITSGTTGIMVRSSFFIHNMKCKEDGKCDTMEEFLFISVNFRFIQFKFVSAFRAETEIKLFPLSSEL